MSDWPTRRAPARWWLHIDLGITVRSMILGSRNIRVLFPFEFGILGLKVGGTSTTQSSQLNMAAPVIKTLHCTAWLSRMVCFSVIKKPCRGYYNVDQRILILSFHVQAIIQCAVVCGYGLRMLTITRDAPVFLLRPQLCHNLMHGIWTSHKNGTCHINHMTNIFFKKKNVF